VRVRQVRRRPGPHPDRVLPLGQVPGLHHPEELLVGAVLAVAREAEHVDLPAIAVDDRPQRREPQLAGLAPEPVAVLEFDDDLAPGERDRAAVEEVVVRARGIDVERVDLVQVRRVVRRRPPEVLVEAAHNPERAADPEVAVEVQLARDRDVRLVVPGRPGEVGVPHQDRPPGPGPARPERPDVRPVIRRALALRRDRRRRRVRLQAPQEPADRRLVRTADPERVHVVPCEIGAHPLRELLGVQFDVAVHPGREPLEDIARVLVQEVVRLERAGVGEPVPRVRVDVLPPQVPRELAPRTDQAERDALAVVLELDVPERVPRRAQVLGQDVRDPVLRPPDLDLPGEVRPLLRGRGARAAEDDDERGDEGADARSPDETGGATADPVAGDGRGRAGPTVRLRPRSGILCSELVHGVSSDDWGRRVSTCPCNPSSTNRPSSIANRPFTSRWTTPSESWCGSWNVARSVSRSRSKTTRSATLPTSIVPRSARRKTLAGSEVMLRIAEARSTTPSSSTYFRILRGNVPYARGCGTPTPIRTSVPSDAVIVHGWRLSVAMSASCMLKETMPGAPARISSIARSIGSTPRASATSCSVFPSIDRSCGWLANWIRSAPPRRSRFSSISARSRARVAGSSIRAASESLPPACAQRGRSVEPRPVDDAAYGYWSA